MIKYFKRIATCLAAVGLLTGAAIGQTTTTDTLLSVDRLPDLPDSNGVAGAFAGVSNGALLAGGGANFPNGMPWENGTKIWHDELYVLPDGASEWKTGFKLPAPRGYGVSATLPDGVICIGGSDSTSHYADTYRLTWDGSQVRSENLPPLPMPLANAGGALIDKTIYVFGGSESADATSASAALYALDTANIAAGWKTLDPLPGDGRILPVVAALNGSLYVASGASLHAGDDGNAARTYLKDAWKYNPESGWSQIADLPRAAVAAPAIVPSAPGNSTFIIISGDDGTKVGFDPPTEHPGFAQDLLSYNEVTNTWASRGQVPFAVVTAPTVISGDDTIVVSGEIRPGVRTPAIYSSKLPPLQSSFGWANYAVLGLYLLGILGIGFGFSAGNDSTEEFFRGGQSIPWWCAGLSIFATTLSSITFMSVPAKAYAEDWVFALANLPILLIAPFIVYVIMPVFRRLDITSAYEYLELRFNLACRLFGSIAFVLFQIGRMAIVMFLPALALATVTNFNITTCILLMGVLTVVYCAFGGIKAVIWTDVVQSIVFLVGASITVIYIIMNTDGGVSGMWTIATDDNKLKLANLTWDFTDANAALWVVLIGCIFGNLVSYASDQSTIQRYMTTESEEKAARSIWLNAFVAIPATVLFFSVGTALYVFYVQHPARMAPGMQNDAVFPLFISRELPAGLAGLLVASIFAAAQSTISTSMNCISTVIVTDWYERLRSTQPADKTKLALARWLTVIFGGLGTAGALWLAMSDIKSVWDVFLKILGLAGGALAGLFLLGILTRRANGTGAIIGAVTGVLALFFVQQYTSVHFLLYAMVGILSCMSVGYLASLLTPAPGDLTNLTIYDLRKPGAVQKPASEPVADL